MPRLTDKQLVSIFEDTSFLIGRTMLWDALTPKQRARAEKLVERKDDEEITKPKLVGRRYDEE